MGGITGLVGVGADSGVGLGVDVLEVISGDSVLDELGELTVVGLLVFLLEVTHVVGDVSSEDLGAVSLGIVSPLSLLVLGGSGETTLVMGDRDTSVTSSLEGSEDLGSGGGTGKTNIEKSGEGGSSLIIGLDEEVLSVDLGVTLVVEVELGVHTTSEEETGGVSGGVVGETDLDSVTGELMRVSSGETGIVGEISREDLAGHILVGETDDESVLGGSVLVLVLDDESLTGVVVGLGLSSSSELDLVTLVVSVVLDNLDERLRREEGRGGGS